MHNNNESPIVPARHVDEIEDKDFIEEHDESDEEKEHHHPLKHPDLKKRKKRRHQAHFHEHHHGENHWRSAAIGLLWGAALLALSLASLNIPMIAYYVITGLTTLLTLYLGRSVYQSAFHALRHKTWDTTTLYMISTLTIVVVSIVSLLVPGLPMMFEAAPFVLGFWHLGEAIEYALIGKISKKLDVRDCISPFVFVKNANKMVSVQELELNDIIIVKKGGVIPVDGVLTKRTLLYTTRVDGSPDLKEFKAGDAVRSGMQLAEHVDSLEMRVTKNYKNSYLSLIAKNIQTANEEKAPVEIFANTVLKYFIPGLITIALISGIVIGSLFNPALAIQCVVSIFVSACPCALSLITPMAVKIGMQKASEKGIHFNNGKALQAAADIDTIVFDLNGTLTKGKSTVKSFHKTDEKLLPYIALLESQSDHPAAKTICRNIQRRGIAFENPPEISAIDKSHHSGIKATINGETFIIGNKDMLAVNGIKKIEKPYNNPENGSIFIVRGTTVVGQIAMMDPLRDDAIATVNQLKRLGKNVHICTGADKITAERYATLLGIDKKNICANTVGADSRYELCLMSRDEQKNDENIKKDKIYLKPLKGALEYAVLGADNKTVYRSFISANKLGITVTYDSKENEEKLIEKCKEGQVLDNLLEVMSTRGHIPLSKTRYIQKLQREGHKVAMVGDAANDITAIARSDIGIAVKSSIGDELTQQQAGIVVQEGSLFPMATAFDVAKKTKRNIFQNLMVSLTYNATITLVAAGLFIALGFALNPALGVALMVLETAIVLGNLYRFKQQEVLSAASDGKPIMLDEDSRSSTTQMLDRTGYDLEYKSDLRMMPSSKISSPLSRISPHRQELPPSSPQQAEISVADIATREIPAFAGMTRES